MQLWRKQVKYLLSGITALCAMMIISIINVQAVEIDEDAIFERTSPFLLTESEMQGYRLYNQSLSLTWGSNYRSIRQGWFINGVSENIRILIETIVFDSVPEAIRLTTKHTTTTALFREWGSLNGSIVGDGSWFAESPDGMFVIFLRGNVGIDMGIIHLYGQQSFIEGEQDSMIVLSQRILRKIEYNLDQEIIDTEEASRVNQIPLSKYHFITDDIVSLDVMKGFSSLSICDSKWYVDETSFLTGIRKELKNETGTVIGIDICESASPDQADSVSNIRTYKFYRNIHNKYLFNPDSLSSLKAMLEEWETGVITGTRSDILSLLTHKGEMAVHIHGFSPDGLDADTFYSIAEQLSNKLTFLDTSVVVEEGNTAEAPQAFTLKQNKPNPFNVSTLIMYEIAESGNVVLKVYNSLGQEVVTLVEGHHEVGHYDVFWNGKDSEGKPVSSGTYLYKLQSGRHEETRSMTLVR